MERPRDPERAEGVEGPRWCHQEGGPGGRDPAGPARGPETLRMRQTLRGGAGGSGRRGNRSHALGKETL